MIVSIVFVFTKFKIININRKNTATNVGIIQSWIAKKLHTTFQLVSCYRYSRDCLQRQSQGFVVCPSYGVPCFAVHNFSELFLIRSLACPHLLFAVELNREFIFFLSSSDQRKNSYDKSSLVVATGFHMSLTWKMQLDFCGYASSLICFVRKWCM